MMASSVRLFYILILLLVLQIFTTACSHTVDFRSAHFAIPVVGDSNGFISASGSQPTEVTIISDRSTNPPGRDFVVNDEDITNDFFETLFALDLIGLEFGVRLVESLQLYSHGFSTFGLKWQLIGDGKEGQGFVTSIQGAYGSFSSESSSGTDANIEKAESKVKTIQYGGSIGYKMGKFVFYVSHLVNNHSVETDVTNPNGSFGPYKDIGVHTTSAIGISTYAQGFLFGLEYGSTKAVWDPSIELAPAHQGAEDTSESGGIRLGYNF